MPWQPDVSRDVRAMSVIEGKAEVKYSLRVFRMLTLFGRKLPLFAAMHRAIIHL